MDCVPNSQGNLGNCKDGEIMSDLKPCPICGGSAVGLKKIEPRLHRPARNRLFSVVCYECELYFGYDEDYGGRFYTEGEAIRAWNRRWADGEDQ